MNDQFIYSFFFLTNCQFIYLTQNKEHTLYVIKIEHRQFDFLFSR